MAQVKTVAVLGAGAERAWQCFQARDNGATAEGELSAMVKKRIAVALTPLCPCCAELHGRGRAQGGRHDAELAASAFVVGALRAGGAITQATHMLKP